MDYAKAAFLKAEDLEARLSAFQSAHKVRNAFVSVKPAAPLKGGESLQIAYAGGEGALALTAKITAEVISPGSIELKIDGAAAGEITFGAAGKGGDVIINSVALEGEGEISLGGKNGFYGNIISCDISLSGFSAYINKNSFEWAADTSGNMSAVIVNNDGKLKLYLNSSGSLPDSSGFCAEIGSGIKCGVAVDGGDCFYIYTDLYKNVWGAKYSGSQITSRKFLGENADSVAIAVCADKLIIAAVSNGSVFYRLCDKNFEAASGVSSFSASAPISHIRFLQGAHTPSIVYYSGAKSYLKTAQKESEAASSAKMRIIFSVEEKNVQA